MTIWKRRFTRTALAGSFVLATAFGVANAQTIVEMSALKCGDYLESPPERQEQFAAWMSGYFNAERNMPMVDLKRFATNKRLVEKYCRSHKKDNLMNVIRKVAI
jgi:acid stress chaperone HdeB